MTVAFFFFDAPETSDIYTLSLHDALPISCARPGPDGLARHHDPGYRRIVRRRNACGSHLWWDARAVGGGPHRLGHRRDHRAPDLACYGRPARRRRLTRRPGNE